LLCRNKAGLIAEYSLKDIEKPIGVSEYRLVRELPNDLADLLPSVEDLATRIGLDPFFGLEDEGLDGEEVFV